MDLGIVIAAGTITMLNSIAGWLLHALIRLFYVTYRFRFDGERGHPAL